MRALIAVACVALAGCAGGALGIYASPTEAPVMANSPHIVAALADARRPEADRERDADRHPADIMAFAHVSAGDRIADVGPGGGYYTRLFAVGVGETGRVYAIDRPNTAERPRPILAVAPDYPNITVVQQGYQGWTAPEPLDTIFISQIYHDFHLPQLNLDVPTINRGLFDALKPGGALIIIDHAAIDGSDLSVTSTLHRIDQATVRRQLEAAGFVYDGETRVLRNREDDRTVRVFEGAVRGHTDQFAMRFRKPAG